MRKGAVAREGYKKTELGWIPEDWEVRRLGESCELLKDGTHSSHIDVEPSQGLPLLSAKDINNGKIFFSQESRHISEVDFKQIHKSYFLSDGDILLTIVASIGRVAVVENYERNYTIQRSIAVIRLRKQFYNYFYFYFFQCLYFQKELIQRSNASAQAGVYLGELSKIKIPLPPLPEQKKIAEILSTWDEAIEKLNSYIEAKKKLKKALMQRLLTGKQRFKEFVVKDGYKKTELGWIPEDWEVKRLGESINIQYGKSQSTLKPGVYPIVGTSGICGYGNQYLYDGESLVIGRKGTIDNPFFITNKFWVIDTAFYVDKFYFCLPYFIFYASRVINWKSYSEASGVPSLNRETIKSIKIPLPPLPEQKKIAEILSKADEEIDLLNQELEKLKTQKKGLMQKLLTGAWRVKL